MDIRTKDRGPLARAWGWVTDRLRAASAKETVPAAVMLLSGVLLSRTPILWGAYPMGLALLCSVSGYTLPTLAGVCLGAATLGGKGIAYIVMYGVAILMRVLCSVSGEKGRGDKPFCEGLQFRLITCATVGMAVGGYEMAVSGISGSSLLFGGVMSLVSSALCGAMWWFLGENPDLSLVVGRVGEERLHRPRQRRLWWQAGAMTFLFLLCYALGRLSLFGLSGGYLFASALTLLISRRFGALRGCAAGLIMGLSMEPLYAPAFGILGLLSGGLWTLGGVYAMALGCGVGVAWCAYVDGLAGFLGVGPEMTVATLISLPLVPKVYSGAIAGEVRRDRAASEAAAEAALEKRGGEQILRLSRTLEELSEELSKKRTSPDPDACLSLCDGVCTTRCRSCEKQKICWDSPEKPGERGMEILAERLWRGQPLLAGDLPTYLLTECPHVEEFLSQVRERGALLWRDMRRRVGADYPAPDFAMTAELMREAVKREAAGEEEDPATAGEVKKLLTNAAIRPVAVRIRGGRAKETVVATEAVGGRQKLLTSLFPKIEALCGGRLTPPSFTLTGDMLVMECRRAPAYTLEVATARLPARGMEISGDTCTSFTSPDGYSYLLLSDGMGSGPKAAQASSLTARFLERMLLGGNSHTASLKLLNRLLSLRGEECTATVDLLEFDLYTGGAVFFKSGAAASYVRREGNLFRLRSCTLPVGVLKEVEGETLRLDTREGDLIVMLSDGVSQTSEDAPWLVEMLSAPREESLEATARAILQRTLEKGGGTDDITVAVARVRACRE